MIIRVARYHRVYHGTNAELAEALGRQALHELGAADRYAAESLAPAGKRRSGLLLDRLRKASGVQHLRVGRIDECLGTSTLPVDTPHAVRDMSNASSDNRRSGSTIVTTETQRPQQGVRELVA